MSYTPDPDRFKHYGNRSSTRLKNNYFQFFPLKLTLKQTVFLSM